MGPTAHHLPQPPTGSLPALRTPDAITEAQVCAGLQNLEALYCPIALSRALQQSSSAAPKAGAKPLDLAVAASPLPNAVDSGYVSEDEDGAPDAERARQEALAVLRADAFERAFATRWLTGFLGRAEEMALLSDEARQEASDRACGLLEALAGPPPDEAPLPEDDEGIMRDFAFTLRPPAGAAATGDPVPVAVQVNDGPLPSTDHTAVGLQSFGACVYMSDLLCATPARFGLDALSAASRVVELGAGTGLVSLVLAKVFAALAADSAAVPRLIATDFHPAVLENLRANVAHNFPDHDNSSSSSSFPPVETCHLDWAAPSRAAPLDAPADLLVATDVIYAPEHALWLRDCATALLGPSGLFWVLIAVRVNGKFEGISDTVEAAFNAGDAPRSAVDGRRLAVLHRDDLAKPPGLGRGDESGYRLFRIGWVDEVEGRV